MPPELYGPAGLLVALSFAVAALYRDHLRSDADDRKERDDWKAVAQEAQRDNRSLIKLVEDTLGIKVPR